MSTFSLNPGATQVRQLYKSAPSGITGHFIGVLIVGWLSYSYIPQHWVTAWILIQCLVLGGRALSVWAYHHSLQQPEHTLSASEQHNQRWSFLYLSGALLTGIIWGSTAIFIHNSTELAYHALILASLLGLAGAGVATLGSIFPVYISFIAPLLTPIALWFYFQEDLFYQFALVIILMYALYMIMAARTLSGSISSINQKNEEIQSTQLEILFRLGKAGEHRDNETGAHVNRMSHSCQLLALQAGLGESFAQTMLYASPMHDVGKIGIPDHILRKTDKLTPEERVIMESHVLIGKQILDGHSSDIMQTACRIAESHHERWDGTGYPHGLSGESIPIEARLTAICDVFDALTSVRPYKKAWSNQSATNYLKQESGKYFDPALVQHFIEILPDVIALRDEEPANRESVH